MQNEINPTAMINAIAQHKKQLILFVLLATVVGTITCLLLPKKYLSSAIVAPVNPRTEHPSYIFNKQPLEPQSVYGMEEDLDRTIANFKLYSNFSELVDSFNLVEHYKIKPSVKARAYATEELVDNSSIIKTEHGTVKINIWDKDKDKAAAMANSLVNIVRRKIKQQNQQIAIDYIKNLEAEIKNLENNINSNTNSTESAKASVNEAIQRNQTAINELKLSENNQATSLILMEPAYASQLHDKPKLRYWIAASLLGSLAFGILFIALFTAIKQKNA